MSFGGFSEADIIKLTQEKSADARDVQPTAKQKKVSFKTPRNHENQNRAALSEKLINNVTDIPEAAKLQPQSKTEQKCETTQPKISEAPQEVAKDEKPQSTEENVTIKVRDLSELQTRQKLMEEQNRKRKELLAKALADRTKRTQEEVQRLNEIQAELKKLDVCLSSDVKILRKQIDVASLDYTEAQKRYLKVEREFLDAKLHLQQKLEKKEMLTEHLCTIIEKNEERKAAKLTELLEKLKLDPKTVECEVQNGEITSSESAGS